MVLIISFLWLKTFLSWCGIAWQSALGRVSQRLYMNLHLQFTKLQFINF